MKTMQNEYLQTEVELKKQLDELEIEHSELNDLIDNPVAAQEFSQFMLQRLKKRKLLIKDKIEKIRSLLFPDLIA